MASGVRLERAVIVGSGLLAKAFAGIHLPGNVMVIARGVSNSREESFVQFQRERDSICDLAVKTKYARWIYFSTCSIEHGMLTPYVAHKLQMEELVRDLCENAYIIRLPQVVGVVNNNTLVSHFTRRMFLGLSVAVQQNAVRRLLDVDDVVKLVQYLLARRNANGGLLLNLAPMDGISVHSIAHKIKAIIGSLSEIAVADGGDDQPATRHEDFTHLPIFRDIDNIDYPMAVLDRYVPLMLKRYGDLWLQESLLDRA